MKHGMADILKKPFFSRQISLGTLVLGFLLVFSFTPLIAFSFYTLNGIISQLSAIEESEELHFIKDELHQLETRIEHYQQMIDFVSQSPSVMEILNHGESRPGSITKETAFLRYTEVLNRAFAKNNDIVSIHILDRDATVQFSLSKVAGSTKYKQTPPPPLSVDPESITKTLAMQDKGFLLIPLHNNQHEKTHQPYHQLLIRILTPIRTGGETIGAYVADIDMGLLTQAFPGILWVLTMAAISPGRQTSPQPFSIIRDSNRSLPRNKPLSGTLVARKWPGSPFLPDRTLQLPCGPERRSSSPRWRQPGEKSCSPFWRGLLCC